MYVHMGRLIFCEAKTRQALKGLDPVDPRVNYEYTSRVKKSLYLVSPSQEGHTRPRQQHQHRPILISNWKYLSAKSTQFAVSSFVLDEIVLSEFTGKVGDCTIQMIVRSPTIRNIHESDYEAENDISLHNLSKLLAH
jgi:hypothetical protein